MATNHKNWKPLDKELFKKPYQINEGDIISLNVTEYRTPQGQIVKYYNTTLKTLYNGKILDVNKEIKFTKGTDLKPKTKIRIKKMYEMCRFQNYIPVWYLYIKDYEVVEEYNNDGTEALFDYQEQLENNRKEINLNDLIN